MSREIEVRVPDIGDFDAVDVVEILVAPGDRVGVEDPLVSLESDKATMEVPSPVAGEVLAVKVSLGDAVSEGSLLVVVAATESADAAAPSAAGPPTETAAQPQPQPQPQPRTDGPDASPAVGDAAAAPEAPPLARFAHAPPAPVSSPPPAAEVPGVDRPVRAHAGPGIRRFARELGVDLAGVEGSGPHGRVLEADLKQHVRSTFESGAARPAAAAAGFERTADVTELEGWRRRIPTPSNETPPPTAAVVLKAALAALRAFPELRGPEGTPLVVAVEGRVFDGRAAAEPEAGERRARVPNADTLGVREITRALAEDRGHGDGRDAADTEPRFRLTCDEGRGGRRPHPIRGARERFALAIGPVEVVPRWTGSPDDAIHAGSGAGFEPRLVIPIAIDVAPDVPAEVADRYLDHWAEILSAPARLLL